MSAWADVVTTALLGTTRRPLPAELPEPWARGSAPDPAVCVLELAAQHRAVVATGRRRPVADDATEAAPPQDRPVAPPGAGEVLAQLLAAADPALIGTWLDLCVRHGSTVPPVHWTALARLAARSTHYDRALLGRALGARGRWFLRQNPDWRRLAADAEADAPSVPPAVTRPATPSPDELAADPGVLFAQPDPWPVELVAAAYAIVGSLGCGPRTRSFAAGVGVRLPPEHYPTVAAAATFYLEQPDASPAGRRAVREAFVALERAAYARLEIARAFDPSAAAPTRVEIPRV